MTADAEGSKGISQNEEKELLRVYNTMCNYQPKSKLYARLQPQRARRDRLVAHRKAPDNIVVTNKEGEAMSSEEIEAEYETLRQEIAALEKEVAVLDSDPQRRIRPADLAECLKTLGKPNSKKEIEEMIWEVDESLDGVVDWEEFKLTYQRNLADTTGLEPCQLFNVIQFMIYDKDGSGKVTVDETMHMLYTRYGRDRLEGQMKLLFGEDLSTQDGDGELSFSEYCVAIQRTNKGRHSHGTSS
ncbi:Calmodulin [Hondaea fermentalgiana]|uniref:Calmodulin n=1 Tax=Hondaea fermentalgiana TaxID=2315210 RepID=A0A2R5GQD3_9STRA|nr:Calmodulin [Hondaea fermentalgiana]|eukprot:GBG32825.1 Calmodulin [Hondaea fermentalgiana]